MSPRKGPFLSCCKNMLKFRRARRGQKSVSYIIYQKAAHHSQYHICLIPYFLVFLNCDQYRKYGLQNPTQILKISSAQISVCKNPHNMLPQTKYRDKNCCQTWFEQSYTLNYECDTYLASWRNLQSILLTLLEWCLCFIHSFKKFDKHYLGW